MEGLWAGVLAETYLPEACLSLVEPAPDLDVVVLVLL